MSLFKTHHLRFIFYLKLSLFLSLRHNNSICQYEEGKYASDLKKIDYNESMADQEQQPVPAQREQQPQPVESGRATAVKPAKQRLEDLISKFKQLEDLKEEYKKEEVIKEGTKGHKTCRLIREELRTIVTDIQSQTPVTEPANVLKLPPITRAIIMDLQVSKITTTSAPVIYELLRISTDPGYNLNTAEGMVLALDAMMTVSQFETAISPDILGKMYDEALRMGCPETDDVLEKVDTFIHPELHRTPENQLKEQRKKHEDQYNATFGPIKAVALPEEARRSIRTKLSATMRDAVESGRMSMAEFEKAVEDSINIETDKVRGDITTALQEAISAVGTYKEEQAGLTYGSKLSSLRSKGLISEDDYHRLLELPNNKEFRENIASQYKKREGDDIVQEAMKVFVPDDDQIRLLRAISSASSLKHFLQTEKNGNGLRYMIGNENGTVNWDAFTKDVKGIFGELLSIADRNPNQFFDQAFNPMYEGHLYQQLLQRITHLGAQINASDEATWFNAEERKIKIVEQIADPNPGSEKAPYKTTTHESIKRLDLGTAVGNYLANNMNDYKMVREHLHNINAICTQGLGWEQLKQYAERLGLVNIDRIMRQEEDLSLASNLLSDALQQEVALNGRVIMPDFGLTDQVWQLNSAERKAFFMLKAKMKAKNPKMKENVLNQQAIQKIRMSAAISYGVTGEFWNIMLTSRMPLASQETVGPTGEKLNEVSTTYQGTNLRGYEKMISELDLDMLLQRFALPKFYNALRYTPRYRNMKEPPGPWSKEGYQQHGINYEIRSELENAVVNGRSDRLIDLDEQYVYFTDYMRTKCVGLFARGGWRFSNWEACKEFKDPETRKQVDYIQTLANARKMGSFITKRFLDEIKPAQVVGMSREEVKAFTGLDMTGSQLSEDQVKKLFSKATLYERILFEQIGRVTPTKFLQMEERRWTPQGEKLLKDHLTAYLKTQLSAKKYPPEIIDKHVYDMYVAALTLAEKSRWQERRQDDQNYEFGVTELESHKDEILIFFKEYQEGLGEHNSFGTQIAIRESGDEFFEILKGFQTTLRKSIDAPHYHNANGTGPRESLQKRFAGMLTTSGGDSKGNIENLIAGSDFDFGNFFFSAAGGYGPARMMGETFNITSKMNPAIAKLINEVMPEFTKSQFKDIHEVEKFLKEKFVPEFKAIHNAIDMMDRTQADEFTISLALFVSNMIGKDRISRIKGIGSVIDWYKKERYGAQSSVYADFFHNDLMRPTHSMDSDEVHAFMHVILNAVNVPIDGRIPDHMETTLSLFGRPVMQKMVYKGEKWKKTKLFGFIPWGKKVVDEEAEIPWTQEVAEKASGLTGMTKWIENYIPMAGGVMLLMLLAMAYIASQKNKKK
jgi:hypothetical protein